jgi:hypothetical protein
MIRARLLAAGVAVLGLLALPSLAQADFGLAPGSLAAVALNKDGTIDEAAGSHPASYTVTFRFNTTPEGKVEGGAPRDIIANLPQGMIGNPFAVPRCSRQQYEGVLPKCPTDAQVGVLHATVVGLGAIKLPIFNLAPPPGSAAQLGAGAVGLNVLQDASVRTEEGYGVSIGTFNIPEDISAATEVIWGVPAESAHDPERGGQAIDGGPPVKSTAPLQAFLTLPTSCEAPPVFSVRADSKLAPGVYAEESALALDGSGQPAALSGCKGIPFSPGISATPTTRLAENPSGLDFELKLADAGLLSPGGTSETQPRTTVVTLPEGVTVNPSLAEGIGVCTPAQYAVEKIDTAPGAGCPEASKLGSVVARSLLVDEAIEGSLYLAAPYENPFDTLTALYMIARAPERGVLVKQAGRVDLDPSTGQITATFSDLPPVPYLSFKLHFREGARAPLATPQACGTYGTVSKLTPFSSSEPTTVISNMTIEHSAEGGACPTGGLPPFRPGLIAGSINNAAGHYSPFNLRLSRTDSEQEITHFSIKLPPGITGKLAGIPFCPEASIAAAKARERTPHGGQEELEHPSCPAASEIGHTLVGAGVGPSLTYVPGKVYLAGPYKGSNLSIASITAAKAGPFDLGTVVIREALKVNPETAEVSVDAAGSDPIPHIVDGVLVHLRDIRVYVDRPEFALNPTSCQPTSTASTVLGSGTDFASEADDRPVTVTTRFQAADCASLGFAPKVALSLKGPTKRAGLPKLKAVVTPRAGDANIGSAVVTLPKSEFLEQGHIGTTCTRVQFNAGGGNGEQCPEKSIYGHAVALTPLLSEPLEGPVFLRSNGGERNLPDLVAALHGADINIDLVGYINSLHQKGSDVSRIRNTFAKVPDAPVSKFTLEMFGGKKGLLVNSANLCKGTHKASAKLVGQNGKVAETEPAMQVQCGKKGKGAKKKRKAKARKGDAGPALAVLLRSGW